MVDTVSKKGGIRMGNKVKNDGVRQGADGTVDVGRGRSRE